MIWALVHNGKYRGWYKIDQRVYNLLRGQGLGFEVVLLPKITAIVKVKMK